MHLMKAIIKARKIGAAVCFWTETDDFRTKLIVKLKDAKRAEVLDYEFEEVLTDPAAFEEVIAQQIDRFVAEW
ncbi:hypothetical protein ACYFX5_11635 [Bremerella sp. T1]|uniref:hypothetical protein n=1 Tax=Bremerella sp. TYQ1 TaxID=3119568 RepID=UPI001CCD3F98|nr:hypothetical protein [Bremerella volcania]UBM33724.1 hypothetical protein LA756_13580 [Bremerella volcania]